MAQINQTEWRPNDWPETMQELRNIDNLFRCSICFEYFQNAVSFQDCSHTYCSRCIRIAMVHKKKCPTCSQNVAISDLKCNKVLNELVKNFVLVRERLLDIVNRAQSITSERNENEEKSDDSVKNFEATPRRYRLNTSSKKKKRRSHYLTPKRKRPRLELDSDSEDNDDKEDLTDTQKSMINTSPIDNADASSSVLVKCPVCEEWFSSNAINSHIDLCLVAEEKKKSLRSGKKATQTKQNKKPASPKSRVRSARGRDCSNSSASTSDDKAPKDQTTGANALLAVGKKRAPIPSIVYGILSEKQLKQKLKEWSLSTKGDRKTLIKRHQDFAVVYNAECDSLNPKPVAAIVKELEIREKRNTSNFLNASSTGTSLNLKRDASEEEVDRVHKQYLRENKDQFEKLIDEIRKRNKQGRGKPSPDQSTSNVIVIDELDSEQDDTESKIDNDGYVELNEQSLLEHGSSSTNQGRKQQSSSSVVDAKQMIKTEEGGDQDS